MALEPGALLNNRYQIKEVLGLGGMGSVYKAEDTNLGVLVAVKENLFTSADFAQQFRREAVILAGLRHPNLPRVTDHFVIEGQGQYLVMDYIEGEDLRQRMDRLGLLSEEEVITIGAAICDALSYLNSRVPPIVHRDIKPGNVKITPQGEIYLVDFGLAKEWDTSQKTATGARAMTPGYSPPEQYGTARTDQRSDIYSLGATLYAALTSFVPEDAMSRAMGQEILSPIQETNPRVSKRLASAIEKALQVRPADRYQSAKDFKQALLDINKNIRRDTGEYRVAPPPDIYPAAVSDQNILHPPDWTKSEGGTDQWTPDRISGRTSLESSPALPINQRYKETGWWLISILVIIVFVASIVIIALTTDLPQRALAMVQPPSSTPTTAQTTQIGTPDTHMILSTAVAAVADTITPEDTELPNETPTPTELLTNTPTQTPNPTPTLTSTPTPAYIGGSRNEIAFASNRTGIPQIYIINVDSGVTRQITNESAGACQPAWSPDGEYMVYISPCERNQEEYPGSALFMVNPDLLEPPSELPQAIPLPHTPGGDYDPDWSLDGKYLVFTSHQKAGYPRIYKMDMDDLSTTLVSGRFSRDKQPAWSPDGDRIAYITAPKGINEIWIMDSDGMNKRHFTESSDATNLFPDWSPNEDIILFTQYKLGRQVPWLVAGYYDEGNYTEFSIQLGPLPMREGRYSPDGLWLVFEGWPAGGNHEIFIMTTNGASLKQITEEQMLGHT